MNNQLARRIGEFNKDYFENRGETPIHFVCPITLKDEQAELIKGHVFSQSIPRCTRTWVPQRKDVDNVFSAVESEFHAAINARTASIEEIISDKKLYKQIRPSFEFKGAPVKGAFHRNGPRKNHPVDFVAHLPASEVGEKSSVTIDSIIERDDCAAAFICALQSAHLTMFELLGYSYVFSYPGQYLAGILNEYVRQSSSDKASKIRLAQAFHSAYAQMVVPLDKIPKNTPFEGTLNDKKLLTMVAPNGSQYATGIATRFDDEFLIVLLPSDKSKREQYAQTILEPMECLTFHVAQIETRNRRIATVLPSPELMTIHFR